MSKQSPEPQIFHHLIRSFVVIINVSKLQHKIENESDGLGNKTYSITGQTGKDEEFLLSKHDDRVLSFAFA